MQKQSDAKTKIEKWNSNPFFKVKRKRKKKYEVQIRFSKLSENEKQKAKFKFVFQCHAKTKNVNGTWIPFFHATVGTKVHALLWNSKFIR